MWICLNNAFLSIVEPAAHDPKKAGLDVLLVRARVKGHIESVFPKAKVVTIAGRDYQFRAYINRLDVSEAIAARIESIHYPNFKNSVRNDLLHRAFARVWHVMADLQLIPPYETRPRRRNKELFDDGDSDRFFF